MSVVKLLMEVTLLLFAIQLLLRTKEVMSGLKGKDFIWKDDGTGVVCHIPPTKTHRRGEGIWVELSSGTQAFKYLVKLFEARDLHNNLDKYVFCMIRSGVLTPAHKASEKAFRLLIKRTVTSIGLNPAQYSGHSCRAGGATDLFAAGIPYYVVKKYGRWKSDTALIYYRCESSIANQAAAAFR
jgi:hypothetical protein